MKKVFLVVLLSTHFSGHSLEKAQRVIREAQKMHNPLLPIQELTFSGPKEGRSGMTQEHEVERLAADSLIPTQNMPELCRLASEWNRFGHSGKMLARAALLEGRSKAEGALAVGNINFSLDVLTDGEQLREDISNAQYVPKEDSEFTIRAHRRIDAEIKKEQLRHAVPIIHSLRQKGINLDLGRERTDLMLTLLKQNIARDLDVADIYESHLADEGKEGDRRSARKAKKKKIKTLNQYASSAGANRGSAAEEDDLVGAAAGQERDAENPDEL